MVDQSIVLAGHARSSLGGHQFAWAGVLGHIAIVHIVVALHCVCIESLQIGSQIGLYVPLDVCRFSRAGHTHRAERVLQSEFAHVHTVK